VLASVTAVMCKRVCAYSTSSAFRLYTYVCIYMYVDVDVYIYTHTYMYTCIHIRGLREGG